MSKKDKKLYQCYRCKAPIKGTHMIAGWDLVERDDLDNWNVKCSTVFWATICGDCSDKHPTERINELYDGDDEVRYWRKQGKGV